MRSTVRTLFVIGNLLLLAAALWWLAGPFVQQLLPEQPIPPVDPRAFWLPGGLMTLATLLWVMSRLTRRRLTEGNPPVAGASGAGSMCASNISLAAAADAEPNLQAIQHDATRLGMTLHTMRAGYVLREASGRELVYADLRLLASALSRYAAG